MKIIIITIIMSIGCFAQSVLTLSGSSSVKQGTTTVLALTSSGATANGPAGLQWTLVPPAGVSVGASTVGAASVAASKQISCSTNNTLCLVYGINQNVIGNGVVATVPMTVSPTATTGLVTFGLTNLVAANKDATAMSISSGTTFQFRITSRADINNDGVVNSADVSLMADQVTTNTCSDDQNGDSVCNIVDVLVVVLRAMGL